MRESMLMERAMSAGKENERGSYVLDTEGEVGIEVVRALAGVRECDLVECDDGRGQLADIFKVESASRRSWSGFEIGMKGEAYRSALGVSIFSMRPAASILSMIFCLDLA
jgi:hypothetical protein